MSTDRFFFCHIPKTAGLSTMASLERQFGKDAIYPLPDDADNVDAPHDIDHLRTVFEARGHQIKVVAGHFPLCVRELLGVPFRTFTVLRDPVDRTLSHLRFQQKIDPQYVGMTLEEAYSVPINLFAAIHNQMVKMLGMELGEMNAGSLSFVDFTQEHLDRAKAALDDMDVVGVQSRYPSFIADLEQTFGWSLGEPVRSNTTEAAPVGDFFAAHIANDNALDVELHQYALELVANRYRAAGLITPG